MDEAEAERYYEMGEQVRLLRDVWRLMHRRCENPKCPDYQWYGARGIMVCARWSDYRTFLTDILTRLGPRPEGCSLDRKNVNGNYEPDNVRWATAAQQAANRRPARTRFIESGQRFGRLVVIKEAEPIASKHRGKVAGTAFHRAVLALCDCGNQAVVKLGNLSKTSSCGCLKREMMRDLASARFGPGGTHYRSGIGS